MARTPILSFLMRLARERAEAEGGRTPAASAERGLTRRDFLAGAAAVGAGAVLAGRAGRLALAAGAEREGGARTAIVGAGIAGLVAAMTLHERRVPFTLYEASGRVGGRMDTDRTSWASGQVTERAGELIDTGHRFMRRLARKFRVHLDDLHAEEPPRSTPTFRFDGAYYTLDDAIADFGPVYDAASADLAAAGYPTSYLVNNDAGRALDALSIREWIESRVPGGIASKMGRLLDVAYEIEYGLPTTRQSALNLVYLLAFQPSGGGFAEFGVSDERFHVRGGNDLLPSAIAAALPPSSVVTNRRLARIAKSADGTYALRFDTGDGVLDAAADVVILTLPFTVLRQIDFTAAGFRAQKEIAIREMGYGAKAKLNVQFASRPWRAAGPYGVSNGSTYSDTGYQATWEVSRAQPGAEGILVNFVGGDVGAALSADGPSDVPAAARRFLSQAEPVLPGLTAAWNGRATLSAPVNEPFRRGSYACYLPGQYTKFGGIEREPEGRCLFAGEHCSQDYQGFMEGAAREGRRAAREALRAVRALRRG